MGDHPRRLDSWKEIAEYLGRDVRTAMRWAKSHGLPVRRVAGGKGRSVFAFTHEIDGWLAGQPPESASAPAAAIVAIEDAPPAPPRRQWIPWAAATGAVVTIGAAAAFALLAGREAPSGALRVSATKEHVTLSSADGTRRVVHTFDPSHEIVFSGTPAGISDVDADGRSDVLVGVAYYDDRTQRRLRSGELLNLAPDGRLQWRFAFDDRLRFGETTFAGPWTITDWQVGPAASPARIAVATHDAVWWASMAAVIDHEGRRVSTFVNPGWIESLLWLDRDQLAAAGFNNARDAAMLAVIDTTRVLAQAPGAAGTPYQCAGCPSDAPLLYATFPRSELNVLTSSRFNRAQVAWLGDRLQVTTIEVPGDPLAATAIYEFDRDLRLVAARYDDLYWSTHRRLELEGRLGHTRAACPDRGGPPAISIWREGAGWLQTAANARGAS